jgi:hypothetical protein
VAKPRAFHGAGRAGDAPDLDRPRAAAARPEARRKRRAFAAQHAAKLLGLGCVLAGFATELPDVFRRQPHLTALPPAAPGGAAPPRAATIDAAGREAAAVTRVTVSAAAAVAALLAGLLTFALPLSLSLSLAFALLALLTLALLTLLAFALLALLTLALLALLTLLAGLVQSSVHRLHAPHEAPSLIERLLERIGLTVAGGLVCLLELVTDLL